MENRSWKATDALSIADHSAKAQNEEDNEKEEGGGLGGGEWKETELEPGAALFSRLMLPLLGDP